MDDFEGLQATSGSGRFVSMNEHEESETMSGRGNRPVAVIQARVQWIENLLVTETLLKSELKKRVRERYGIQNPRTIEEYITRARERLMTRLMRTKDEHRLESLSFYEGMLHSTATTPTEKIRARERIDKLLGLEQPMQIQAELSTKPMGVPVDQLPLAQRKQLLDAVRTLPDNTHAEDGPW